MFKLFSGRTLLTATADDSLTVFVDGVQVISSNNIDQFDTVEIPDTCVVAVHAQNFGGSEWFIVSSANGRVLSDVSWRCSEVEEEGWLEASFNDSQWAAARISFVPQDVEDFDFIWSNSVGVGVAYCRKNYCQGTHVLQYLARNLDDVMQSCLICVTCFSPFRVVFCSIVFFKVNRLVLCNLPFLIATGIC